MPPTACTRRVHVLVAVATLLGDPGRALAVDPSGTLAIVLGGDVMHGRYHFRSWETHAGRAPLAGAAPPLAGR